MKYKLLALFIFLNLSQNYAQVENPDAMNEWQYPYEVHKVTVADSIDIAYVDEGKSNISLLFIHGLGSNLQAWKKNIEHLKDKYRCIAVDLPGYGKSSKSDYPFDMSFFAKTLHSFIQELQLTNVVLIGHSMGGQVAIKLALKNPEYIEKLVLVAPAGFEIFSDNEKKWFETFYTPSVVKATTKEQIKKNFRLNFYSMPEDANFMIEDRFILRDSEEYEHYCKMIPKCVLGMLNEPVLNQLDRLALPTLILFGKEDLLIPNKILHPTLSVYDVGNSGHDQILESRIEFLSEAGHFVHWERPNIVNEFIIEFIN